MKLGTIATTFDTRGYGRWGKDTYRKLRELGYSCTDFDLINTEDGIYPLSDAEARARLLQEKALAQEAGIEFSQAHGPWRFPPQDNTPEERAERMEKMKHALWATDVIGCKNYVIHPIMPYGMADVGTEDEKRTWEANLVFMKELLDEAKKYGITICLENMPMTRFSIATPEAILRFVKEMDDENFKICLDTGHVSVFRDLDLAAETRRLGTYIRALHVHDNFAGMDMHLMPFYGRIDWRAFAAALGEIGYSGAFSLETSPAKGLSDPLFADASRLLANIAKDIVAGL